MALKEQINDFLDDCIKLCSVSAKTAKLTNEFEDMKSRLKEPLRVAVVGTMKAGKSTFMNALMGENLLSTGVTETTYTVCWFKYASEPSITIHFREGSELNAPFEELENWSVRATTEENINKVKYVIINYPSEVLKEIEFIDTPGLNSKYGTDEQNALDFINVQASENSISEVSTADAILYAFNRSTDENAVKVLQEFHSNDGNTSPINAVGILTKADVGGVWKVYEEPTPVEATMPIATKSMETPIIKQLLYNILPVTAMASAYFSDITEEQWRILKKISVHDEDAIRDIILDDAYDFIESEEEIFASIATSKQREELINILGQFGILEIALRLKYEDDKEKINEIINEKSGMKAVRDLLTSHFGNRTFLIKTKFVFSSILSMLDNLKKENQSNGVQTSSATEEVNVICKVIKQKIERFYLDMQTLQELNVLSQYYTSAQALGFDSSEVTDLLSITGEYGRTVEHKLQMPINSTFIELEQKAKEKANQWRAKCNYGFFSNKAYTQAAKVISRSYEKMYYHLNALNDM